MLRRTLLLAALCASGCTSSPLPSGRYACTPGAPETEEALQCPENWRCGLENYCHEFGDTRIAWLCKVDDDCENGFHCGLAESRKVRECHDSEKPVAHACNGDGDCVLNWRCGLEGVCHSREIAARYACRTDAGIDDSWCQGGWRCAPEGACTDPRADALRPFTPPAFPSGTVISPDPTFGPIERFSASQIYPDGLGARLQTLAYVSKGSLIAYLIDRSGEDPPRRFELGPAPAAFAAHGSRAEELGVLLDTFVMQERTRVYAASDGGIYSYVLESDGTATRFDVGNIANVSRFNQGSAAPGLTPRVVGFDPDPLGGLVAVSGITTNWQSGYSTKPGAAFENVPFNTIRDVAHIRGAELGEAAFAIDSRGLWMMARTFINTPECFLPVVLPPLSRPFCLGTEPVTQKPTMLRPLGRENLGVASRGLDGGEDFLSLVDVSKVWTTPVACNDVSFPCTASGRLPLTIFLGPCRACPSGALLDFALVEGKPKPRFEYSCSNSDGGSTEHFSLTTGAGLVPACTRVLRSGESSLFDNVPRRPEQMAPGLVSYSNGLQNIWTGPTPSAALPLLLDRAPAAVARTRAPSLSF